MRLDRYAGAVLGRKARVCAELIWTGALEMRVNGAVTQDPSWEVYLGLDVVDASEQAEDGVRRVWALSELPQPLHRLLLLHKPAGYVCGPASGSCRSVYDLIPAELRHSSLGGFGRLDAMTTGLYIFGTDGGLQSLLLRPASGCRKRYLASLHPHHPLRPTAAAEFAAGLAVTPTARCAPGATLEYVAPDRVRVSVAEGAYHQVRRMIGACGGGVIALHRESIGGLELPSDLAEGACRLATREEMEALCNALPADRGASLRRARLATAAAGPDADAVAGRTAQQPVQGLRRRRHGPDRQRLSEAERLRGLKTNED